jgi:hypothetical protein
MQEVLAESVFWTRWDLSGSGIYFATQPNAGVLRAARLTTSTVRRLDLQTGRVTEVLRREGAFRLRSLSVSMTPQTTGATTPPALPTSGRGKSRAFSLVEERPAGPPSGNAL